MTDMSNFAESTSAYVCVFFVFFCAFRYACMFQESSAGILHLM